jgi:hypothetical protein
MYAPSAERLVVDALLMVAFRMLPFCAVSCVAVVVAKVVVPVMFADPVMVAPVAERLVVDALPNDDEAAVKLVVTMFVVDALERLARPVRFKLPIVAPSAERLVVDAFTMLAFCVVKLFT